MELIPESTQQELLSANIPKEWANKSALINGFKSSIKQYTSFNLLCQYFISPHFDIYIYQLQNKEAVRVFLQSNTCKWLLFYQVKGQNGQFEIEEHQFEISEKSSFFAKTSPGKSIKLDLGIGGFLFICCNLKMPLASTLQNYYTPVFKNFDQNPILLKHIPINHQMEWEKILNPEGPIDLLPSSLHSKIQLVLANFCTHYKERINIDLKAGMNPLEKEVFEIKTYIDCYPFKRHTLQSLCRLCSLTKNQLRLFFKRQFGKTVFQYSIDKRLSYSAEMLINQPNRSIKDIAISCGFRKSQHFIYQFRQKYQQTPLNYRKTVLKTV
ncbi:helix-turn-helix transcriptional regulator [Sediminibacterium salmoneum]|uniref:helix-turn-helix transcriptional regulator n=1 Tax=Sediminibacterium salmoneum TaxID=426421 RepID=UPI00047A064E|nr:helix-turn-helix transcriptional regulator [Sediminibacterium salmoneum]